MFRSLKKNQAKKKEKKSNVPFFSLMIKTILMISENKIL